MRKPTQVKQNDEQGCILNSYKKITGRGVKMCPNTLGS